MRWGKRSKHDHEDHTLSEEVERFLAGNRLHAVFHTDREVPAWVWLSALAHGDEATLSEAETWQRDHRGIRPELDSWGRVLEVLSRKVRDTVEAIECPLEQLQRDVLVPLELSIMCTSIGPATLYRVTSSTLTEVENRVRTERS